jgi:hypothetical protein
MAPEYPPQAASVCGHHIVDVDLEMERAVLGLTFVSRYVGRNHKIIGSGRCDQLHCVAPISIESRGDLHGAYLQLCRLDWAQ